MLVLPTGRLLTRGGAPLSYPGVPTAGGHCRDTTDPRPGGVTCPAARRGARTVVPMIRRGASMVLVALLLAGCTSSGGSAGESPSPSPPTATLTQPPPASPTETVTPADPSDGTTPSRTSETCKPFGSTNEVSSADPHAMTTMTGAAMRVGRHDCFERFVFELQGTGPRPGWTVGYRDPLAGQGSGDRIRLKGDADLEILVGAWTVDDFEGRPPEWPPFTGPDVIVTTNFEAIKEARNLYAYEGVTQIGLGIDEERPFQVVWFPNPDRLVVDVYTGEMVV